MKVTTEVVTLILEEEHLCLSSYQDPGGVWTIGYGCTTNVKQGDTCTEDMAKVWFLRDLNECAHGVLRELDQTLNNDQFSALVSLAYNIGLGNFASSTLLKKIKSQDFQGAADEFLKWDHIGSVEYAGLKGRREKERQIFLKVQA